MKNKNANSAIQVETSDLLHEENLDSIFTLVKLDETESEHIAAEPYSYWKSVFRTFLKKPSAIIGLVSLSFLIVCMIFIPMFAPESAFEMSLLTKHAAPSAEHWFGCDSAGRDLFFMCWAGLRKSFALAIISSSINIVIGTIVGLAWGYIRALDRILIEVYNLISNIPGLLLWMLLSIILSANFPLLTVEAKLIITLTITGWLGPAMFVRNQTILITNREYNVASKTLGTPTWRIMIRNLLPYLLAVIITNLSLSIPGAISSECSLSFFGVGLPNNAVSIGAILDLGRKYFTSYPWEFIAPSAFLAAIIFAFYLIGLALSDALDPKKHR